MLRRFFRWIGFDINLLPTSWETIEEKDLRLQLEVDGQPLGIEWKSNIKIEKNVYTGRLRGFFEDRTGHVRRIDDDEVGKILQWDEL